MKTEDVFNAAIQQHQAGNSEQAERLYREVLAHVPDHGPSLQYLGLLLQTLSRRDEAADVLGKAVSIQPHDAASHNNLANLLRELGRRNEAIAAYEAALSLRPDYVNAQYNLATLLLESGDARGAERLYRQVVEANPTDVDALSGLGVTLTELDQLTEALECFQRAARLRPSDPDCYYNLGNAFKECSQLELALEMYRRALELEPDYAKAQHNIGMVLKAQGWRERAIVAFEEAIRMNPGYALAYRSLASALQEESNFDRAMEIGQAVVKLEPGNAGSHLVLANALTGLERWQPAEAEYRAALALEEDHLEVWHGLGNVLLNLRENEAACDCFEQALDIDPEHALSRCGLGRGLHNQNRLREAIACYRAVPAYDPAYATAQNYLGNSLQLQGHLELALAAYERALAARPDYVTIHDNILFCLNYLPDMDPERLFERHRSWAKRHVAHLGRDVSFDAIDREPGRRLRIGYISPDFKSHPVAFFIVGVIEAHDRESFETFCYSDVSGGDIFTTRFESSADQWRDIRRLTNEEVADEIRADRIDILVELTGHTSENRLMVMARRPAPIQVSYIGYPNTTGMEQIDYRITDARADPPGSGDELYSETLVRLPSGFLCYRPWVNETTVSEPPSLTRGHVTFGSFNNTVKVTADVIKTWARILLALPGSRLVLKAMQLADDEARKLMLKRFESHGVTKERIELHGGFIPRDDHLNVYANVDVGLDPFPYNGATTTCEALSMGVPVICLDGDTHRARVGVSLLSQVGLTELIADTVDDYVRLAVHLARDPHYLTELRASLRNRLGSSPLMDAHATTKELEKAYRTMWRTYCQQPVESNSDREDSDFLRLHIGGSEPKPGWKI